MTVAMRLISASMLAVLAMPAAGARPGPIGAESRGTVIITAMVAGQARLSGGGDATCLWSNTATRLIDVTTDGDAGGRRAFVAAATPSCAGDGIARSRTLLAGFGAAGGAPVAILVSPE